MDSKSRTMIKHEVARPWFTLKHENPSFPFPKTIQFSSNSSKIIIGRLPAHDIVLPYLWISRTHCELELDENQACTIKSLSVNGLFVNSVHVLMGQEVKLKNLDKVEFLAPGTGGYIMYEYHCSEENHNETKQTSPDPPKELMATATSESSLMETSLYLSAVDVASSVLLDVDKSEKLRTEPTEDSLDTSTSASDPAALKAVNERFQQLEERIAEMERHNQELKGSGTAEVKDLEARIQKITEEREQSWTLVQLQRFIAQEFSCGLCREILVQSHILNCGHSFCAACLEQHQRTSAFCPKCHQTIYFKSRYLMTENYLSSVFELLPQSTREARKAQRRQHEVGAPSTSSAHLDDSVVYLGSTTRDGDYFLDAEANNNDHQDIFHGDDGDSDNDVIILSP